MTNLTADLTELIFEMGKLKQREETLKGELQEAKDKLTRIATLLDKAEDNRDTCLTALAKIEMIQIKEVPDEIINIGDKLRWLAREALLKVNV